MQRLEIGKVFSRPVDVLSRTSKKVIKETVNAVPNLRRVSHEVGKKVVESGSVGIASSKRFIVKKLRINDRSPYDLETAYSQGFTLGLNYNQQLQYTYEEPIIIFGNGKLPASTAIEEVGVPENFAEEIRSALAVPFENRNKDQRIHLQVIGQLINDVVGYGDMLESYFSQYELESLETEGLLSDLPKIEDVLEDWRRSYN